MCNVIVTWILDKYTYELHYLAFLYLPITSLALFRVPNLPSLLTLENLFHFWVYSSVQLAPFAPQ